MCNLSSSLKQQAECRAVQNQTNCKGKWSNPETWAEKEEVRVFCHFFQSKIHSP